jgi:hypothetical protein
MLGQHYNNAGSFQLFQNNLIIAIDYFKKSVNIFKNVEKKGGNIYHSLPSLISLGNALCMVDINRIEGYIILNSAIDLLSNLMNDETQIKEEHIKLASVFIDSSRCGFNTINDIINQTSANDLLIYKYFHKNTNNGYDINEIKNNINNFNKISIKEEEEKIYLIENYLNIIDIFSNISISINKSKKILNIYPDKNRIIPLLQSHNSISSLLHNQNNILFSSNNNIYDYSINTKKQTIFRRRKK